MEGGARGAALLFAGTVCVLTPAFYWVTVAYFIPAWEARGRRLPRGYAEKLPPWAFTSSAALYVAGYAPLLPLLIWDTFAAAPDPAELLRAGVGGAPGGALFPTADAVTLAAAFACMAKDGFLFPGFPPPDWLLAGHHLGVMIVCPAFLFAPGARAVRVATFSVPVAELGTACYCAFLCWRERRGVTALYAVGMTASNALLARLLWVWVRENWDLRPAAFPAAVGVICGLIAVIRQYVCVVEVWGELGYQRRLRAERAASLQRKEE